MSFGSKVRDWLGIIDLDGSVLDVRSDVLDVREQLGRLDEKLNVILVSLADMRREDEKRWLGSTRLQGKISGHVVEIQKVVTSASEAVGHIEESLSKESAPKHPKPIIRRQWSEDMPEKEAK